MCGAMIARTTSGALLADLPPEAALTKAVRRRAAAWAGRPVTSIPHFAWALARVEIRWVLMPQPPGTLEMRSAEARASASRFRCAWTLLVAPRVSSTPRSFT